MFWTTANTGTNPRTGAAARRAVAAPARDEVTRLRLFCFHHAGGSAWSFAGWGHRLGSGVEVVPVSMPPRAAPTAGVPGAVSTMDALVEEVTRQLTPALEEPYALYGHSMGSLVAHGVAQRQLAAGRRPPDCFVAGAHRAPHLPAIPALEGAPSDEAALELLLGLGGAGRLLRESPARMRTVVDRLREDLRVCATHRRPPSGHRPLPCPLHVVIGDRDPLVSVTDAEAWRPHTSAHFTLHTLPGGHFFVGEHEELFFRALRRALGAAEY